MTEPKWTKGPWEQCKNGNCTCGVVWSIPGDFPVCTIGGRKTFECHAQFPVAVAHTHMADAPDLIYASLTAEQAVANANLMAAAPDLYEATDWVDKVAGAFGECSGNQYSLNLSGAELRALIDARRKARGCEP